MAPVGVLSAWLRKIGCEANGLLFGFQSAAFVHVRV